MSHIYVFVEDSRTHRPLTPDRMRIIEDEIKYALRGLSVSAHVTAVE